MPMTLPASRVILEVERAISDVRRGVKVKLQGRDGTFSLITSGEHVPGKANVKEPAHAAVQLMKIAGLLPEALVEPLQKTEYDLLTVSEAAIEEYPFSLAASLDKVSEAFIPLKDDAQARVIAFRPRFGHEEHLAVIIGTPAAHDAPLVRVHSSCITGDVFGSLRCDCGEQIHKALSLIHEAKAGVIIYLSQEGRGIGIANKLRAYNLQDEGLDTVEANESLGFDGDERDFALAASMLKQLGIQAVTLLTNNPQKTKRLEVHGITVKSRLPVIIESNIHNQKYLETKADKLGHQL